MTRRWCVQWQQHHGSAVTSTAYLLRDWRIAPAAALSSPARKDRRDPPGDTASPKTCFSSTYYYCGLLITIPGCMYYLVRITYSFCIMSPMCVCCLHIKKPLSLLNQPEYIHTSSGRPDSSSGYTAVRENQPGTSIPVIIIGTRYVCDHRYTATTSY